MIIGKVRELRTQRGLTQFQLAQLSGVSLPTIQNIEALKANPSISILEKIFNSLNAKLTVDVEFESIDVINLFNCTSSEFKNYNLPKSLKTLFSAKKQGEERSLELRLALAMSLLDHYPQWLKKKDLFKKAHHFLKQESDQRMFPRLIKFRRIWLAKLSEVI